MRDDFIERKLDRALVNSEWFDKFPNSHATFHAPGISDHSPITVDMGTVTRKKGIPLKFYNYWASLDNFDDIIDKAWNINIEGAYQFQLCQKLRNVKTELKKFTKNIFGREKINADNARKALMDCQTMIDQYPDNLSFRAQESDLMINFLEAIIIEEETAKQKSRNQWLEAGDRNTKYFYNAIKGRRNINRIFVLSMPMGTLTSNETETKAAIIRYFEAMLGTNTPNCHPGKDKMQHIVNKRVSDAHFNMLDTPPDDEEIKKTMFSIHSNKAPGPDGFNAFFFKHCWNIVGPLVTKAIKEFFSSKELLAESNTTIISLIPKVPNPTSLGEFRPISCCNTVYKCISKIISYRLQGVLPELIDNTQSAFIKGRKICDNVLLAQDLMRDYHKSNGRPRAAAKVDLMKAYDTVSWDFFA